MAAASGTPSCVHARTSRSWTVATEEAVPSTMRADEMMPWATRALTSRGWSLRGNGARAVVGDDDCEKSAVAAPRITLASVAQDTAG